MEQVSDLAGAAAADWIVAPREFEVGPVVDLVSVTDAEPDEAGSVAVGTRPLRASTAPDARCQRAADGSATNSRRTADGPETSPRRAVDAGVAEPAGAVGISGLRRLQALVPAALRGARFDPGRRGTAAIAALVLVAVVSGVLLAWQARPEELPVGTPVPDGGSPVAGVQAGGGEVVVAVAGRVRRPGLVRLRAGARVADAVQAAGGVLPGTELGVLNLARRLTDGELVVVGGGPPGAATGTDPGKVDLNTATVQQLDGLPGVGPVLAGRIVEYRTAHGGFRSVNQLREVDGIGESRFQRLKELVAV